MSASLLLRALGLWGLAAALPAATDTLLKNRPLEGEVATTYWTFLASQNPYRIPDQPTTMKGTMTVASPGYGATLGLYSWTGNYSTTVTQSTSAFDIQQAVYQLDVTWDPATSFPFQNGPLLSYNGGSQRIPAALPKIVEGLRVVENNTNIPEMEGIESFAYRGVTWQWDLSGVAEVIHSVQIYMPFANHTSLVGTRIDVASEFAEVGVVQPPTPLESWRQTHFQTVSNSGAAADDADPDGDGLTNLLEYGLGGNPRSAAGAAELRPKLTRSGSEVKWLFTLPASPPADAVYRVKTGDDLQQWTTLATKSGGGPWVWTGEGASRIATRAVGDRVEVTLTDTAASPQRRWMILEVGS